MGAWIHPLFCPKCDLKEYGVLGVFYLSAKDITLLPFWRWFITLKALLMLNMCSVTELHSQHVSIIN